MRTVDIRQLENRLSEYLHMVRRGERILVTDRGAVVAEIRQPASAVTGTRYPRLHELARQGFARIGAANDPDLYPVLDPVLKEGEARRLLDE